MAGRTYNASFRNVSVSAVQDLIAFYAGANMAFEVISFSFGQITNTTIENLQFSLRYLPVTVTSGSGGSAGTMVRDRASDAAAIVTSRVNDTVQATTSGAALYPHADVWNEINGYMWIFPEGGRPVALPSTALVLSLDSAPASARVMSGTMKIRELF